MAIIFNLHKKTINNPKKTYENWIELIDDSLNKAYTKGIKPSKKTWYELGVHDLKKSLFF